MLSLTNCRAGQILSYVVNLCKQVGPRSGLNKSGAESVSKLFHTADDILDDFFIKKISDDKLSGTFTFDPKAAVSVLPNIVILLLLFL